MSLTELVENVRSRERVLRELAKKCGILAIVSAGVAAGGAYVAAKSPLAGQILFLTGSAFAAVDVRDYLICNHYANRLRKDYPACFGKE